MTYLDEKLRFTVDVENNVRRSNRVIDAIDLIARLTVIVALVSVGDIFDVQVLLLRVIFEQNSRRRATQWIGVVPFYLWLWVAVKDAGQLGLAAHQHRLRVRGVEQEGRVEHV